MCEETTDPVTAASGHGVRPLTPFHGLHRPLLAPLSCPGPPPRRQADDMLNGRVTRASPPCRGAPGPHTRRCVFMEGTGAWSIPRCRAALLLPCLPTRCA